MSEYDANFRGDSAAASLKQRVCTRPRARSPDFRGDSAAASLKRRALLCVGRHPMRNFRGDSAAASLKPLCPFQVIKEALISAAIPPRPH